MNPFIDIDVFMNFCRQEGADDIADEIRELIEIKNSAKGKNEKIVDLVKYCDEYILAKKYRQENEIFDSGHISQVVKVLHEIVTEKEVSTIDDLNHASQLYENYVIDSIRHVNGI